MAKISYHLPRRDGRVVEGDSLENYCGGNLTVGSNPTLSASRHERSEGPKNKGFDIIETPYPLALGRL